MKKQTSDLSQGEVQLHRPILGNTLIFLDTGYFRDYCRPTDQPHNDVLKYAAENKIVLCTSKICIEEWRTQLLSHLNGYIKPALKVHNEMRENNILAKKLFEGIYDNIKVMKIREEESRKTVEEFISAHQIKVFDYKDYHIAPTWEAYFLEKKPPFQKLKCRDDIPDAWICEGAKDVMANAEYAETPNKLFFTTETKRGGIIDALSFIGLSHITPAELVRVIKEEEQGITTTQPAAVLADTSATIGSTSSLLDDLLSKALSGHELIWLHLLGFVEALDTPIHSELINSVAIALNVSPELVALNAKYLASGQYLQDTGNHYIVGNQAVCEEAANRLTGEIIKMLGLGE